jgi:hypothetical protein
VSCAGATSCFTAGSSSNVFSGTRTLVTEWNGSTWTIAASPTPPGPVQRDQLLGVSCASAASCFAVGSFVDGDGVTRTLVEQWNGTTWAIATSPNPSAATSSTLRGASCVSATSCFAVGDYETANSAKTLIEHWDGTSWTIVASPNPSGTRLNYLSAVSCVSASSCFTVGQDFDSSGARPLIEHWNGTSWSIAASPSPPGATFSGLSGVSCTTVTNCFAVGVGNGLGNGGQTLVERWNGVSWNIVASPNPAGTDVSSLQGVSCTSASNCFAVGASLMGNTSTLVERWNGTSWNIVTSPNPSGASSSGLAGISCIAATSCFAVGNTDIGGSRSLIEQWNGTNWSVAAATAPPSLNGVSCISATSCFAVGGYFNTLIERYA